MMVTIGGMFASHANTHTHKHWLVSSHYSRSRTVMSNIHTSFISKLNRGRYSALWKWVMSNNYSRFGIRSSLGIHCHVCEVQLVFSGWLDHQVLF
jgi:hypothetical protein